MIVTAAQVKQASWTGYCLLLLPSGAQHNACCLGDGGGGSAL